LPRPAWPNLPGLVIPENIVAIRRPPMPAPRTCGGHEQDRGGEGVDPEQQRGTGNGLDMRVAPVPRRRGGLPGGGWAAAAPSRLAPPVPARGRSPGL